MVQKIVWTPRAETNFDDIIAYLTVSFGESTVYDFTNILNKKLDLIKTQPKIHAIANKKKNIRKAVFNKRLIIFYRLKPRKGEIELISLWDTRQKPKYK